MGSLSGYRWQGLQSQRQLTQQGVWTKEWLKLHLKLDLSRSHLKVAFVIFKEKQQELLEKYLECLKNMNAGCDEKRTERPQVNREGYYEVGVHKPRITQPNAHLRVHWCKKPWVLVCRDVEKCNMVILSHDDSPFIIFSISGRVQVWCTSRKQYRAQCLTPTVSSSSEFSML